MVSACSNFNLARQLIPTARRMFPLTPFRYLVGGLLANSLGGVQLTCTDQQIQFLNPPAGVGTCQDYLGEYVASATGFLTNPNAVGQQCG